MNTTRNHFVENGTLRITYLRISKSERRALCEQRIRNVSWGTMRSEGNPSHPRSAKDVPILYLEVLAKTFDVFDQIPGRVFFQTRGPIV